MTTAFDWLPGPRILVLGAGASGLAATRVLVAAGREVTVVDTRREAELPNAPVLRELGVRFHTGRNPEGLLAEAALLVTSPGIPPSSPILRAAFRRRVPVWGELELGYRALGEPADRILAVTGTKGKSSTVTMLTAALRHHGIDARAAGNLGLPLTAIVGDFPPSCRAVLEVSSFQLASIRRFRAGIAVLLATAEDHLDWHPDVAHYHRSKSRILSGQRPGDHAVFDASDPVASILARSAVLKSGASLMPFAGRPGTHDPEVVFAGRRLVLRRGSAERVMADLSGMALAGSHQERNLAAVAAAASLVGVARASIEAAAAGFTGLPHALEELPPVAGVRFVNDSRATSVLATRAALRALHGRGNPRVRLILGGILKGGRFSDLAADLGSVVRIHAIGVSRDRILRELSAFPVVPAVSLREAVVQAHRDAAPGDVVLLSPGCSSFDDFRDYRDRGEQLRAIAAELAGPSPEAS